MVRTKSVYNCNSNSEADISKNNLLKTVKKDIKYGANLENFYNMCIAFSKNTDLNIKSVAIRSLGFIFTSYPGLLLRSESIIKYVLGLG